VAEIQARLFELLPNPPLTTGQVDLLKADNVASGALPGLQELNIQSSVKNPGRMIFRLVVV
jgi:NADH dehydrogenase